MDTVHMDSVYAVCAEGVGVRWHALCHPCAPRKQMAELAPRWRVRGRHASTPRQHGGAALSARGSPEIGDAPVAGDGTKRKRREKGSRCAHPGDRRGTEAAGGEERAAARYGSWWRRRSRRGPARRRRAPGAQGGGDADGGGGWDAAAVTAAQSAAACLRWPAMETSIPACSRGERRGEWRRWTEEETGHLVLLFIGRGRGRRRRSCAGGCAAVAAAWAKPCAEKGEKVGVEAVGGTGSRAHDAEDRGGWMEAVAELPCAAAMVAA